MKRALLFLLSPVLIFLTASCLFSNKEVKTSQSFASERQDYFRGAMLTDDGLFFESENFLRGNLLMDEAADRPGEILRKLREYYGVTQDPKYLVIAADYCRWMASASDGEKGVRFALTGLYYIADAMKVRMADKNLTGGQYRDIVPFQLLLAYNECSSVVFDHLKKHDLLDHDAFYLRDIEDREYRFEKPVYELSVPKDALEELSLCAYYSVENLMLKNRRSGVGVPLVGKISQKEIFHSLRTPSGMAIPVTMLLRLLPSKDSALHVSLRFIDTTLREDFVAEYLDRMSWPLALDFSTPLACFLNSLPERNLISVMLHPDIEEEETGLFMVEPYNPKKIPVLFVHGLMSSPETWVQMINSLKNDPLIREKYQFWFYRYSSGSPIIVSAAKLNQALLDAQQELCTTPEATANFNQMVVVGHSMGGLLTRLLVQQDPDSFIKSASGKPWAEMKKDFGEEEIKVVESYVVRPPLPFISRVIFMAVPHRGADMAQSPIAKLGIFLIQLPSHLTQDISLITNYFSKKDAPADIARKMAGSSFNGIDNLNPDSFFIRTLAGVPIRKGLPFHSIIGNQGGDDQPGGSDGVVPYVSSHLDSALSEMVVDSNHSVHRRPRAMREVQRILRLHIAVPKK